MKKTYRFAIIVVILALLSGFVGSYLGNELYDKNHPDTIATNSNTREVHYSVESSDLKTGISNAYNTVVEIYVNSDVTYFFQTFTTTGAGSGVIISDDGYIITNNHVVKDAKSITIKLYNGETMEAELVGTDPKTDIAVIKVDAKDLPVVTIGDSSAVQVGDDAFVIGNPLGYGISASEGIISAKEREIQVNNEIINAIQTTAAINGGNSGGGLFNIKGELIGIVNSKSGGSNVEGMGYAIPINEAIMTANDLIQYGHVKNRAALGVGLSDVTNYRTGETGVMIAEITEDGAADKAGLKKGDLIIGYNDIKVSSYAEVSYQLKQSKVGDTIKLTIKREDKEMSYNVTLQESN